MFGKCWYPIQKIQLIHMPLAPCFFLFLQKSDFFVSTMSRFLTRVQLTEDGLIIELPRRYLLQVVYFLKLHWACQFSQLFELTAQDTLHTENRFFLHYFFLSVTYNSRLRLKLFINELTPVATLQDLFFSSVWLEREVWDMFGLIFTFHRDLRRLLTDYGFQGFPLRKDFPLSGFYEVYFDEVRQGLQRFPVSLAQEFRVFSS